MKLSRIRRHAPIGAALFLVAPLLAGCGGGDDLSRTFGLTRDAPDEFVVTTRAPLSMPPDFTLRPPQPGASRPQELSAAQAAEVAITGNPSTPAPGPASDSPGQDALLAAAGAPAPADIRAKVDAEFAELSRNHSLTESLLFWQNPPKPGVVVDASKEAERLHENAALGKPPDEGDTPVIQRKTTSWFDNIF
jgi:hypothetical protein